jgi:hypothetical protein
MTPESERACLARLHEMDQALARMERELPDDVRQVGREARQRVALWLARLAAGGVELAQFNEGMREIAAMMDALTARLLLAPWDGPPPTSFKS